MKLSRRSRLLQGVLRLINLKRWQERRWESPPPRAAREGQPPRSVARGYQLSTTHFNGRPVYEVCPARGASSALRLVYLHGGGFVTNLTPPNWSLVTALVDALHCRVIVPDYPLAPEHPAPAAQEFVAAYYQHLLSLPGVDAAEMALVGDSAGATLALQLSQQLRDRDQPQPRRLTLLWPWVDLAMTDPAHAALEPIDPVLSVHGVRLAAQHYAGPGGDPADPALSPIFDSLTGLPPISIYVGTRDLLQPDSQRLRAALTAAGAPPTYHEYEGQMHGWMLMTFLPEAKQAIAQLVQELRVPARVAA